jgi:sphingomyelin phosphodiesterase
MLGSGPVYAALGNHDSYNEFVSRSSGMRRAVSDPKQSPGCASLSGRQTRKAVRLVSIRPCGQHQLDLRVLYRNYDHVSKLWEQEQWLPESAVAQARAHYAAYSVQRTDGLRIITLNTDFCKRFFARLYRADTTHMI